MLKGENEWRHAKVISKAGKSVGGNKNFLNINDSVEGIKCIDFEKAIESWERVEEEEILFGTILNTTDIQEAKKKMK